MLSFKKMNWIWLFDTLFLMEYYSHFHNVGIRKNIADIIAYRVLRF